MLFIWLRCCENTLRRCAPALLMVGKILLFVLFWHDVGHDAKMLRQTIHSTYSTHRLFGDIMEQSQNCS